MGHENTVRKIQGVERGYAILKSKQKGFKVLVTLVTILCLSIQTLTFGVAYAKVAATSGVDDYGTHWKYDKVKRTLTITGKGEMHDYFGEENEGNCPWEVELEFW